MSAAERIREWVEREFTYKHDEITQELIDAATGNRQAPLTPFHRKALAAIFPEWIKS